MRKLLFQSAMISPLALLLVFCSIIIIPGNGYGQRVSLSLSKNGFYPFQNSLYRSQYTPPWAFLKPKTYTSAASQDLVLDAESSSGTSLSIAVSVTRRWDILFRVDWATSTVSGLNKSYSFSLDYVSMYPSDMPPRNVHVAESYYWPETTGELKHLSFSLNAQARFRIFQGVNLELSGGLTYFILKGEASSLGFTLLWMGGHEVFGWWNYQLKFSFGPQETLGGNLGLGIEIPVIRPVFIFAGVHAFFAPKIRIKPKLEEFLNKEDVWIIYMLSDIESISDIEPFMNLQPLELNPGRIQLHLGIRLRI